MIKRSQGHRAIILIIYVAILLIINYITFGSWIPEKDYKGLWFYVAMASIMLGNLLVTPFYTKPVDAISYSVVSIVAIFLVNDWLNWNLTEQALYIAAISFLGSILIFSFLAIITKDSEKTGIKKLSKFCMIISEFFGNQRVIFSVVILYAIILFHRNSAREMFFITLSWVLIVVIEPDKHLYRLWNRIYSLWKVKDQAIIIGNITAYQIPKMILIRQDENSNTVFGSLLIYKDSHATVKTGVALNYVGRDETLLLRAIEFEGTSESNNAAREKFKIASSNSVASFDYFENNPGEKNRINLLRNFDELIGIVDQNTTIEQLQFEVIRDKDIEEGRLVEVEINGKPVLYQIMDGLTTEDIVSQKNKYGYAKAMATKIGVWEKENNKFKPAKWLPNINSPVFLKKSETYKPDENTIGHFPETNYTVAIKDIDNLITHNTAILGILGVGKSMLSIELVERIMARKIKVICIDLTNQYENELTGFFDKKKSEEFFNKLQRIGEEGKKKVAKNVEEGGSVIEFYLAIKNHLSEFLQSEDPRLIEIFNPTKFEVWRQDSKPYNNVASMASLTPTGVTEIISSVTLEIMQEMGMTDKARVCLVYEEAHSLIPEWNSVATEGDKEATNGTARAILQGRKYGMGCLLITQRTANVTKTILNQCNSIFAMRTFDDTGKNFLANYIGSEYSDRLSSIQERHAVFYGKASTCENPVLIRLNDRDKFVEAFRVNNPIPEVTEEIKDNEAIEQEKAKVIPNKVEEKSELKPEEKEENTDDGLPF